MSRAWEDGQTLNWALAKTEREKAYLEGKIDGYREALESAHDRLADQEPSAIPKRRGLRAV